MKPALILDAPTAWPLNEITLQPLSEDAVSAALRIGLSEAIKTNHAPGSRGGGSDEPGLSIALLDDAAVMRLNAEFRDRDEPTNVLSWPAYPGATPEAVRAAAAQEPGHVYWGDLALAGETVAREAKAAGKSVSAHLSHLIIHGVLHLLGYDHIEEDQAELMESLERRAMDELGYDNPYGDSTDTK